MGIVEHIGRKMYVLARSLYAATGKSGMHTRPVSYTHLDVYKRQVHTLIDFVQRTQPKEWARFENANQVDPVRKFCTAFNTCLLYTSDSRVQCGTAGRDVLFEY